MINLQSSSMRRARILAFLLDLLLCAAIGDAIGLALTAALWTWAPAWRGAVPWVWAAVAAGTITAFLLRDASGGRARRWLALEVIGPEGRSPGVRGSIRRNLPLIVPVWNLFEAWPVLRDGLAQRPADRRGGTRVVETV
jgi:RDD family protein